MSKDEMTFSLYSLLAGECLPTRYRKEPTRVPKTPLPQKLLDSVLPVKWGWKITDSVGSYSLSSVTEEAMRGMLGLGGKMPIELTRFSIDCNAGWLSGAASVRVAMEQLERTGPLTEYRRDPGYYLIKCWDRRDVFYPEQSIRSWSRWDCPHPLGVATDRFVWVPEPVLTLLHEVAAEDDWFGTLEIHDSWTCPEKTDLRSWTSRVDMMRLELKERALEDGAAAERAAEEKFKVRYAQAIQMLRGGENAKQIVRPDWYDAIVWQHTVNQWRKVWRARAARLPIVQVGGKDEIVLTEEGMDRLVDLQEKKPPIRLHPTALGAYKVKQVLEPGENL